MIDSIGSNDVYVVIERQAVNKCPLPGAILDGGVDVGFNGILYVSASYVGGTHTGDFVSFAALLVANPNLVSWVFDIDTGAARYYDGTGNFWTPMQRALGWMQTSKVNMQRPVEVIDSFGDEHPSSLKSHVKRCDFTLNKIMTWKRRVFPNNPSRTNGMDNQFGFMLDAVFRKLVFEITSSQEQKYYLVILHSPNKESDVATYPAMASLIMPCCQFESVSPTYDMGRVVKGDLSGKATYYRLLPEDYSLVADYVQTYPAP